MTLRIFRPNVEGTKGRVSYFVHVINFMLSVVAISEAKVRENDSKMAFLRILARKVEYGIEIRPLD